MELLRASHLSHAYEYPLFQDISLSLHAKESYAVIGVSGSGKSTILHVLSTLLKPRSGLVEIFGKEMYSLDDDEILKIRRYDIGIIFQFHYLFKGFSAYENIEIASILTDKAINPVYLEKLHIKHLLHKPIGELSGGQQQRISIARILSKQPKIIFADEPTGNLDKETAKEVMDILFEYIQTHEAALFLVTHDEQLARKCTHVTRLKDQKLIEVS